MCSACLLVLPSWSPWTVTDFLLCSPTTPLGSTLCFREKEVLAAGQGHAYPKSAQPKTWLLSLHQAEPLPPVGDFLGAGLSQHFLG